MPRLLSFVEWFIDSEQLVSVTTAAALAWANTVLIPPLSAPCTGGLENTYPRVTPIR